MADDYVTDGLPSVTRESLERLARGGTLAVVVNHLKHCRDNLHRQIFKVTTDWDKFNQQKGSEVVLTKCIDYYQRIIRQTMPNEEDKEKHDESES